MCGRFHPDRFFEVRLSKADYEFLRRKQAEIEMRRHEADGRKPPQSVPGFTSFNDVSLQSLLSQEQQRKVG